MSLKDNAADFSLPLRQDRAQRLMSPNETAMMIPSIAADRLYQLAALVAGVFLLATLL